MQMKRFVLSLLTISCAATTLSAQFKYDKIKDDFLYDQPRVVEYYTQSRFNRTEGPFLHFGVKLHPNGLQGLTLNADAGWAFSNKWMQELATSPGGAIGEQDERFQYTLGVQQDFFLPQRLSFGASYFDAVYTSDQWVISGLENSIAALFGHNDYMDYIGRKGVKGFVDYKLAQIHNLRVELSNHDYAPLNTAPNTDFSIFARGSTYPQNPQALTAANIGDSLAASSQFIFGDFDETSLRFMGSFDFRDNPVFPIEGWYFEGVFEKTFGDVETSGLFLTAKTYYPTTGNQKARAKLMFGSRTNSFFFQHLIGLGGVGSLRGYRSKEFVGNRALFGTVQYQFGGDILQKLPLRKIPFGETLSLGAFFDFGYAWIAERDVTAEASGLFSVGEFSLSDLKTNVGFSLIITEGLARFDFARRLDGEPGGWQVYFRILDNF